MKPFTKVMAAGCLVAFASALSGQPNSLDDTRREIEAVYQLYIQYFAEADAEGIAGLYAKNGARLSGNGNSVIGREAVEASLKSYLDRVGSVEVKINIGGFWRIEDTVYETGSWSYTYAPTGQSERTTSGKYLTTWKLQSDGEWRMVADISLP